MKPQDLFQDKIFTVSEFNNFANDILTPLQATVVGEISDWRVSQGKFVWFSLKDEEQTLNCFSLVFKIRVPVEEGMSVKVTGYPKIYGKSGRFSFVVEKLELTGEGSIRRAYLMLKKKLSEEGLFEEGRKRPLPKFPHTIGLITSPEAAAYTDFLTHLNARWGGLRVVFVPVAVQGVRAVTEVIGALEYFNSKKIQADVVVLTRGGGSLEDLKEFNSEEMVRAVFASKTPVLAAIGHERDTSLVELVADARASTPTHAAQLVVPSREEVLDEIDSMSREQAQQIAGIFKNQNFHLSELVNSLQHSTQQGLNTGKAYLEKFFYCFALTGQKLTSSKNIIDGQITLLRSLSPQNTLKRGYSIVRKSGKIVRTSKVLNIGDTLEIQPGEGLIGAEVIKKDDGKKN